MRADGLIDIIDAEVAFIRDRLPFLHDEWRALQKELNGLKLTLRLSRVDGQVPPVPDVIGVLRRFEPLLEAIEPEVIDPYAETFKPIPAPAAEEPRDPRLPPIQPVGDPNPPRAHAFDTTSSARESLRFAISDLLEAGLQAYPTDQQVAEERRRQREARM